MNSFLPYDQSARNLVASDDDLAACIPSATEFNKTGTRPSETSAEHLRDALVAARWREQHWRERADYWRERALGLEPVAEELAGIVALVAEGGAK